MAVTEKQQVGRYLGQGWGPTGEGNGSILPGKSHRQRSLAGYSPRGRKVRHN